jgi:hypothetical protein
MSTDNIPLTIAWFENQGRKGEPAYGDPERTTWGDFTDVFTWRREGDKDGPNFVPARFRLEPDGRRVRRLKANLLARTAIALDIEANKKTGELPPGMDEIVNRVRALGWACLAYTSHNNRPDNIRYRVVMPLSAEISYELPAPEITADALGVSGVLDTSKIGAASLFFLPSCPYNALDLHQTDVSPGRAISADWMTDRAGTLLAVRQAEADRIAAEAHAEAAARREAKMAAGFDPDDSLIEKLRVFYDLDGVLRSHEYYKAGTKYRHANSQSGSYGANIKVLGGAERVFSHNAGDPLHRSNLPRWCDGVTALDVKIILDYGGDRTRALHDLAKKHNLSKAAERKTLTALLFRLIRQQASQAKIEALALAEGQALGLSVDEIRLISCWVIGQATVSREAA